MHFSHVIGFIKSGFGSHIHGFDFVFWYESGDGKF